MRSPGLSSDVSTSPATGKYTVCRCVVLMTTALPLCADGTSPTSPAPSDSASACADSASASAFSSADSSTSSTTLATKYGSVRFSLILSSFSLMRLRTL